MYFLVYLQVVYFQVSIPKYYWYLGGTRVPGTSAVLNLGRAIGPWRADKM